jgi:hypothetical protein
MTREDQVLVANVMVTNSTRETMAMNVISRPISVIVELNTITKICKYRRLHEGYHFIPMAMEVHGTPDHDMDRFIKDYVRLFHDRRSRGHLSFFFAFSFSSSMLVLLFSVF